MSRTAMNPRALALVALALGAGCKPAPEFCDATVIPPVDVTPTEGMELCNGLDDDQDGTVDEGYLDVTGDGEPDCGPFVELCNGVDDNYNGLVDEGFPDDNNNGIADCLEVECEVEPVAGADVTTDPTCPGGALDTSGAFWTASVEWHWEGLDFGGETTFEWVHTTPLAVSHLCDLDLDGQPDPEPIVVVKGTWRATNEDSTYNRSVAFALDGAGASTACFDSFGFDLYFPDGGGFNHASAFAAGNVDGDPDGWVEVVGIQKDTLQVVAFNGEVPTSPEVWTSTATVGDSDTVPVITDLDGDGASEVLVFDKVLRGLDGSLIQTLDTNAGALGHAMPAVGDIDLDGTSEIALGDRVYRLQGGSWSVWWEMPQVGAVAHWNLIVQADADDQGEVFSLADGAASLYQHDGTQVWSTVVAAESGVGPPCMADFDGDGANEVAFSTGSLFHILELDGTATITPITVHDDQAQAGCSGFDFDNDGAQEIIFADSEDVYIFDGAGQVLWTTPAHLSETSFEYVSVADIDGDGSAELMVPHYDETGNLPNDVDFNGLDVYGQAASRWAEGGAHWPLHDYNAENMSLTGEPAGPGDRAWLSQDLMRALPTVPGLPDLEVEILDACSTDCTSDAGDILVEVQVTNRGNADVDAGLLVLLWSLDGGGAQQDLLAVSDPLPAIPASTALDSFTFTVPMTEWSADAVDIFAIIDDVDAVLECDETDNSDTWGADICP